MKNPVETASDLDSAIKAWNRSNTSTAQLALLQTYTSHAIALLFALGERGYTINGLHQFLRNIEDMKDARKRSF